MRVPLILLFSVCLCIAGYALVTPHVLAGVDFSLIIETSFWRIILLFFAMLLGSFAHAMHFYLGKNEEPVSLLEAIKEVLQSKAFARAVIVSPIVFFAVYNVAKQIPDDVIAFCVSFQNGFFWKTIFDNVHPSRPTSKRLSKP